MALVFEKRSRGPAPQEPPTFNRPVRPAEADAPAPPGRLEFQKTGRPGVTVDEAAGQKPSFQKRVREVEQPAFDAAGQKAFQKRQRVETVETPEPVRAAPKRSRNSAAVVDAADGDSADETVAPKRRRKGADAAQKKRKGATLAERFTEIEKLRGGKGTTLRVKVPAAAAADADDESEDSAFARPAPKTAPIVQRVAAPAAPPAAPAVSVKDAKIAELSARFQAWKSQFVAQHGRTPKNADLDIPQYAVVRKVYNELRALKGMPPLPQKPTLSAELRQWTGLDADGKARAVALGRVPRPDCVPEVVWRVLDNSNKAKAVEAWIVHVAPPTPQPEVRRVPAAAPASVQRPAQAPSAQPERRLTGESLIDDYVRRAKSWKQYTQRFEASFGRQIQKEDLDKEQYAAAKRAYGELSALRNQCKAAGVLDAAIGRLKGRPAPAQRSKPAAGGGSKVQRVTLASGQEFPSDDWEGFDDGYDDWEEDGADEPAPGGAEDAQPEEEMSVRDKADIKVMETYKSNPGFSFKGSFKLQSFGAASGAAEGANDAADGGAAAVKVFTGFDVGPLDGAKQLDLAEVFGGGGAADGEEEGGPAAADAAEHGGDGGDAEAGGDGADAVADEDGSAEETVN
eukprot:TRINITY_DN21321_c0_g1_i1.p1 TRINITY_DN21321_c0_g1~~TRINITY_DN21321_c0_g1_i1.p1  ORF type:complete len:626 (+),score=138.81 TRINITY_DN21321_c0_g1_i1:99-1976(+)